MTRIHAAGFLLVCAIAACAGEAVQETHSQVSPARPPVSSPALAPAAPALLDLYPLRLHTRYAEVTEEDGAVRRVQYESFMTPVEGASTPTWDDVERDVAGVESTSRSTYSLDGRGLVQTSYFAGDTKVDVVPPRVKITAHPHAGDAWEADHVAGTMTSHRSCHIVTWSECDGGLEVDCSSTYTNGMRIDQANRFCRGVGEVGVVATVVKKDGKRKKVWSEELRNDPAPPVSMPIVVATPDAVAPDESSSGALTESYASNNGLITVKYPMRWKAETVGQSVIQISRSLAGSEDEDLTFISIPVPIDQELQRFTTILVGAEIPKLNGYAEVSRKTTRCAGGVRGVEIEATWVPPNNITYRRWSCTFLKSGRGYSFAFDLPQTKSSRDQALLKSIVDSTKFLLP